MDKVKMMEHLNNHMKYPASASDIKTACNNLSEFSDEDKKWFSDHLTDGTYNSADEVMKAVGM